MLWDWEGVQTEYKLFGESEISNIKYSVSHTHVHVWLQAPTVDCEWKIIAVCTPGLIFISLVPLNKPLHLPEPTPTVHKSRLHCVPRLQGDQQLCVPTSNHDFRWWLMVVGFTNIFLLRLFLLSQSMSPVLQFSWFLPHHFPILSQTPNNKSKLLLTLCGILWFQISCPQVICGSSEQSQNFSCVKQTIWDEPLSKLHANKWCSYCYYICFQISKYSD